MAYLGIDYGMKRIGVAGSNEDDSLAFPLKIVSAGNTAIAEISALARERKVEKIVIGESKDFSGNPNPVMKAIESFAESLRAEGFDVIFEPEFFTSAAASRISSVRPATTRSRQAAELKEASDKQLDASAAALILQSFLDRIGT